MTTMQIDTSERQRSRRAFFPLLVAQFFGAFNDNAFKMIVVLLGLAAVNGQGEVAEQGVTTLAFVVLTLPLMLGSLPAMLVGDRVSKRDLVVWTKAAEVLLMAAGTVALWWQPNGLLPYIVLGGMGLQSAMFAPGKYGLLPELLPENELYRANGRIEAASFAAIILGTLAGGLLLDAFDRSAWIAAAVLTIFAILGLFVSLRIPAVPKSGKAERPALVFGGAWRVLRQDKVLAYATLGTVLFWSIASLIGQDVLVYGKRVLGFGPDLAALPDALFAIGVGVGSLLAGRLARTGGEVATIPLGAILLAIGTAVMGVFEPGRSGTFVCMAWLGVASGLVVVPLNALFQTRAPRERRGAVIALLNLLSFAGMLLGNFACFGLASFGIDCTRILLVTAVVIAVVALWSTRLMRAELLRFVVLALARGVFRLRVVGAANVPAEGAALLVCNHVSFLDGILLSAATKRPIRFLVDQSWYDRMWLRPLWRCVGAIPICARGGPRAILHSLRTAGAALDAGEVVGIFAEGEVSRTGSLLPFRRGLEKLVRGRQAALVPVHLDRVYGSVGSAVQGRLRVWPRRLRVPVTVSFGAAVEGEASPRLVRERIADLGASAFELRSHEFEPLHRAFVRRARRAPFKACLAEVEGRELGRFETLVAALCIARRLAPHWSGLERVGMLLPTTLPGALVTLAASLAGRCLVPLNFTVGGAAFASALRQADLHLVVTSRAFLDKLPSELRDALTQTSLVFVEDLAKAPSRRARCFAAFAAAFLPLRRLERFAGCGRPLGVADTATILFSSGSTGDPKGVVLSHRNVQACCTSVAEVLPLGSADRLASVLPLFHSFGYMAVWYALGQGAGIALHPNPLDAVGVGDLVTKRRATILIATPTLLQLYMRRLEPACFGSLRLVLSGAEKLSEALAEAFADHFGVRPVQGYGVTECAPVIALSVPGYRAAGFYQSGTRRSSVGRPVPGVALRIVDKETLRDVEPGRPGLILARGANVMEGYLGQPSLTAKVKRDGYYDTGDVGYVDDDGFLFLTGRLSRFSKIGGEMVPHGVVEDHLHACSGQGERVFAVCGVPDAKKGERLVVLTTLDHAAALRVLERASTAGVDALPALFLPKRDSVFSVKELPMLGTGKLDLRRVHELAVAAVSATAELSVG